MGPDCNIILLNKIMKEIIARLLKTSPGEEDISPELKERISAIIAECKIEIAEDRLYKNGKFITKLVLDDKVEGSGKVKELAGLARRKKNLALIEQVVCEKYFNLTRTYFEENFDKARQEELQYPPTYSPHYVGDRISSWMHSLKDLKDEGLPLIFSGGEPEGVFKKVHFYQITLKNPEIQTQQQNS